MALDGLRKFAVQAGLRNKLRDLDLKGVRKAAPGRPFNATTPRAEETPDKRESTRKKRRPTATPQRLATPQGANSAAAEKHYRVKELAAMWRVSPNTVRKMLENEAGVLRIGTYDGGKREYWTLSVPESVMLRVHARLTEKSKRGRPAKLHVITPGRGSLPILRLPTPRN